MPIDLAGFREHAGKPLPKEPNYGTVHRPVGHAALEKIHGIDRPVPETFSVIDSETGFELTMTNELFAAVRQRGGLTALRPAFESLRQSVLDTPFDSDNLDRQKRSLNGQAARIIKAIPEDNPLASLVPGVRLAIKTAGLDTEKAAKLTEAQGVRTRSPATEQFRTALAFQQLQEADAPGGFFGFIRPVKVYGVLREPDAKDGKPPREWLLMERIEANRHVENKDILVRGRLGSGFSPAEYPELGSLVVDNPARHREPVPFDELVEAIAMNYPAATHFLGDFGSENVLEVLQPRDENGVVRKQYVIIDPEPLR